LHYGVAGVGQARALKVGRARVGRRSKLVLRLVDDLSSFDLQAKGVDQAIPIELVTANRDTLQRHTFDTVAVSVGEPTHFDVTDWANLGPSSLGSGSEPA
jgi:hypothetical protein